MATLPTNPTIDAIYRHYELSRDPKPRSYLGGSEIGHECRRRLWYSFRWARSPSFDGRILRLFETGHKEEDRIVANLRAIGVTVQCQQMGFAICKGHVKGHIDGACIGLLEAPKTWHLLECKTANKKSFDDLDRHGCQKSKPVHYAQCQLYMGELDLRRAAYVVQCKDDDRLYLERIRYDKAEHEALVRKGAAIVGAESPPDKINESATFYQCKFCPYAEICHYGKYPQVNCRTCVHSSPIDNGQWSCSRDLEMGAGCDEHLYIPDLVPGATPIDGSPTHIVYQRPNGERFANCAATGFPAIDVPTYSSLDLYYGARQ